jgi:hypothetical protein
MINFSVLMTPRSKVSLEGLWEATLPEVIAQLTEAGYSADEDDTAQAPALHGLLRKYRVEPGPATLTAVTNDTDAGSIQFVLTGPKFDTRSSACVSAQKKPIQFCGCDW